MEKSESKPIGVVRQHRAVGMRFVVSVMLLMCALHCYATDQPLIESHHADLVEVRLHYQTIGSGVPIVFLHGGSGTCDAWEPYLLRFADSFRIVAPDSRGHGQSSLGNGPLSYRSMAGDIVQLLDHLRIDRAHIVGHSDGGVIALHLLIDHPDRLFSATLLGTPYHIDNYPRHAAEVLDDYIRALATSDPAYERILSKHAAGEDPEQWSSFVNRLGHLWRTQPTFSEADLRRIHTPVLIVKTDQDFLIPPAVFDRMAGWIRGAQVLHLPEGNHSVYRHFPDEVSAGIRAFLSEIDVSQ